MWGKLLFDAGLAALLVACWYAWFRRANRQRAARILRWIDCAFGGRAATTHMRWHSPSRFDIRLQLWPSVFRRVTLSVQMEPREMPLNWVLHRLRRQKETVTFEAELDCKPAMTLYVQNHRWCGRTLHTRPSSWEGWHFESLGPVVISTREDWQKDVGHILESLLATRSRDFLHVAFRKSVPHFVACAPLSSLRPEEKGAAMFEVLRELASSSSASRP